MISSEREDDKMEDREVEKYVRFRRVESIGKVGRSRGLSG
jgi:hypothetical protein